MIEQGFNNAKNTEDDEQVLCYERNDENTEEIVQVLDYDEKKVRNYENAEEIVRVLDDDEKKVRNEHALEIVIVMLNMIIEQVLEKIMKKEDEEIMMRRKDIIREIELELEKCEQIYGISIKDVENEMDLCEILMKKMIATVHRM